MRDKKLIAHDKDIDIGVLEEVDLIDLMSKFKALGYTSNLTELPCGDVLWVKKFFGESVLVFEIQQHYISFLQRRELR